MCPRTPRCQEGWHIPQLPSSRSLPHIHAPEEERGGEIYKAKPPYSAFSWPRTAIWQLLPSSSLPSPSSRQLLLFYGPKERLPTRALDLSLPGRILSEGCAESKRTNTSIHLPRYIPWDGRDPSSTAPVMYITLVCMYDVCACVCTCICVRVRVWSASVCVCVHVYVWCLSSLRSCLWT